MENSDFWSFLAFIFVILKGLSACLYFLVREFGVDIRYVTISWKFKCWKHCFQTWMIVNVFLGLHCCHHINSPRVAFGMNRKWTLSSDSSQYVKNFSNNWSYFFSTSRITQSYNHYHNFLRLFDILTLIWVEEGGITLLDFQLDFP